MDTVETIEVVCLNCAVTNSLSLTVDDDWQFFETYGGDWAKEFECWKCKSTFLKFKRYESLVPIPKRIKEKVL